MFLESLRLVNYRNYCDAEIKWHPQVNMIWGENGQGKSNVLEAIYYLSSFTSFRSAGNKDLIYKGERYFYLEGDINTAHGHHNIRTAYSVDKNRMLKLDNIKKKKIADLVGNLNSVIFSPEDLYLVKGSPSNRRKYIDSEIIQTNPVFYYYFQRYQKILQQRNNILKNMYQIKDKEMLKVFNEQIAEYGGIILKKRLEILERLTPLARLTQRKLTNGKEELSIGYECGIDQKLLKKLSETELKELILERYEALYDDEIKRGISLFGPHRDDLSIKINGDDIKIYGSQGQQRTSVLSLKIAELELMKGQRGEYPVLLLDDVLSELDENRREQLIAIVDGRIQTFITGTKANNFFKNGSSFICEKGQLIKLD